MGIILILIIAAIIGSFLNMLIYRLPKMVMGENISPLYPQRSFCPKCKHALNLVDLIPIISFLFTLGKCRYCKKKINIRYILVELTSIISSVILFYEIGFNIELGYFLILTYGLILLFWTDFENKILPDIISIPLIWLGLIYNLQFRDINSSIFGAVIGYLSLWSIFWLFKLLRNKEGMGYGDFKLFALIGAWFGWQILNPILLMSALLGIIFYLIKIKDKNKEFAFGTFMIIALVLIVPFKSIFIYI